MFPGGNKNADVSVCFNRLYIDTVHFDNSFASFSYFKTKIGVLTTFETKSSKNTRIYFVCLSICPLVTTLRTAE
jgi:hypothetical protein